MHYFEKYRIMVVRIMSKFELKRLCKAFGCAALSRLDSPTPEEMGKLLTISKNALSRYC